MRGPNVLTDYYKFVKLPDGKSKQRIDCVASTHSYPQLELLRDKNGRLKLYVGSNYTDRGKRGKSDLALSGGSKHITSLDVTDIESNKWYGDYKGTSDALLFSHNGFQITDGRIANDAVIEIFVARGYSHNKLNAFTEFEDGQFDEEIEDLRRRAIPENEG